MCLYPKIIKNPKYTRTKKNQGNIPLVKDERVKYLPIGCNKCMECMKKKARDWQQRLLEDIKEHKNGKFITLTFSNQSIRELNESHITKTTNEGKIVKIPIWALSGYEKDNAIATRAMRLFNERWRKKHKKALRHWMVTELGHQGTENIHIHGIVWTDKIEQVKEAWQYGHIWDGKIENGRKINYVNESTISYMTKYVHKVDEIHKTYRPIILTSPGIGSQYTKGINSKSNKYNENKTNETYRTNSGHKIALPIYWRNKIYTEEQREQLWIKKLDKQQRWICGERVDISMGEEEYYRLLQHHRKRNIRLGYGTDEENWEREKYEEQRRELMQNARIQNTTLRGSIQKGTD